MFLHILLFVFLIPDLKADQDYRDNIFKHKAYAKNVYLLLLDTMRTYYETSLVRIAETKDMRFMYEESPYYEQGYVLGEIIERYRKSVEHVNRSTEINSQTVFDDLKRTELLQKLHFEIYHLCNMLHEIPLKYSDKPEFSLKSEGLTLEDIWTLQNNLDMERKKREKERKKRDKIRQKLQLVLQAYIKQQNYKGQDYNKWWPLDYGWEIDYYW